jgi:hypothetical protein
LWSVGSKGDSYDNALAETINDLYKAELIHRRAPWKTRESVELATLEWVAWFNHQRLLEPMRQSMRWTWVGYLLLFALIGSPRGVIKMLDDGRLFRCCTDGFGRWQSGLMVWRSVFRQVRSPAGTHR